MITFSLYAIIEYLRLLFGLLLYVPLLGTRDAFFETLRLALAPFGRMLPKVAREKSGRVRALFTSRLVW